MRRKLFLLVIALLVVLVVSLLVAQGVTQEDTPLVALSTIRTATPTHASAATLSTEQLALTPVTSNTGWQPVEHDFSDVKMVLVPAGCFMMGSDSGSDDEKPVHEQCFYTPFWLDKYEVTNIQYGSTGCESTSSESNQPRNCVTWSDAQAFCEARGGRLPTESEWEYAARGPDGFVYPWGDEFVAENVVYRSNSGRYTADVGSRPGGASWVGAVDMSGNVWEWTSSPHKSYPYDDDLDSQSDASTWRVMRGGSYHLTTHYLRATARLRNLPDYLSSSIGFRCVRS